MFGWLVVTLVALYIAYKKFWHKAFPPKRLPIEGCVAIIGCLPPFYPLLLLIRNVVVYPIGMRGELVGAGR